MAHSCVSWLSYQEFPEKSSPHLLLVQKAMGGRREGEEHKGISCYFLREEIEERMLAEGDRKSRGTTDKEEDADKA